MRFVSVALVALVLAASHASAQPRDRFVDLSRAEPSRVEVRRYPIPPGSRRGTFAVRARYAGGRSLTWPASAAGVRAGDTVRAGAPIHASIGRVSGEAR